MSLHAEALAGAFCRHGVAESKAQARSWGPDFQSHFLQNLGIAQRLERLLDAAGNAEQQDALYAGAIRLIAGSQRSAAASDRPPAHSCQDGHAEVNVDTAAGGQASDGEEGEDGLGYQYMAMAITPADMSVCAPFAAHVVP